MTLSETQEKELARLYWKIYNYAEYLSDMTYNPYGEVEGFARKLKSIIGNDELIRKEETKNEYE